MSADDLDLGYKSWPQTWDRSFLLLQPILRCFSHSAHVTQLKNRSKLWLYIFFYIPSDQKKENSLDNEWNLSASVLCWIFIGAELPGSTGEFSGCRSVVCLHLHTENISIKISSICIARWEKTLCAALLTQNQMWCVLHSTECFFCLLLSSPGHSSQSLIQSLGFCCILPTLPLSHPFSCLSPNITIQ